MSLNDKSAVGTIRLVVVSTHRGGIRCVYLNDHRIAGAKPYISENLPQTEYYVTLKELKAAGFVQIERKSMTAAIAADKPLGWTHD